MISDANKTKKKSENEPIDPSLEDNGAIWMNNAYETYHILSWYFYEQLYFSQHNVFSSLSPQTSLPAAQDTKSFINLVIHPSFFLLSRYLKLK